mgnify:FL=1
MSLPKCSVLYVGRNNPKHQYRLSDYVLANDNTEVKDLWIIMDRYISFTSHCNNIAKRAKIICNLILRSFTSRNPEILIRSFIVYVRPVLEYASIVWNPYLIKDINVLENVQKNFTKRILADKTLSYTERLKYFSIETLEKRRLVSDLSLMYSIVKSNVIPFNDFFTLNKNITRSNHPWKLQIQKYHHNIRKNDFSNRVILVWNSLPLEIVESHNPKNFMKKLKKYDLSKYLLGPL